MVDNLSLGDMKTLNEKNSVQQLFSDDKIGGYKVIKQLGSGGMGQVYLAENIQMHKQYALKVLPPHLSQNQNFIDRFRVEARVMADLEHQNIVGVMNIGHDEKRELYYLIMQFIEAGENKPADLEVLLKDQKKLPEEQVLKLTKQICSALDYAHNFRGKGIVHRDLKPSNILLDTEGNAHIADFGLAKVVGQDYLKSMKGSMRLKMAGGDSASNVSLGDMNTMIEGKPEDSRQQTGDGSSSTNTAGIAGSLIGTYEYMAPEQQEGQEATIQSDIYSLGLIIYRMLTGRKVKGLWKMPSELGCNNSWDDILRGCIEHESKDRFKSVSEITALLDFNITGKSKSSSKKIKKTQSGKSGSGKKTATLLILLLVIAGIGIGGWYGYKTYATGLFKKGEKYYKEEEYSKALGWFKKAADKGNADAQSRLGRMYYEGRGVTQDYPKAMKWYRKAVDKGDSNGMCNIGVMYYEGQGVTKDYSEAMKWLRKAADMGNANAMNNLGYMYQSGQGVTKDYPEAMKWYRKAADMGNANAMYSLGYMYQYGQGVTEDYPEAMKWYRKAVDKGNANGMYMGHAIAMNNIGVMYQYGQGVTKDYPEAMKWYRKAADKGDATAMNNIGVMYQYGQGVTKDYSEAMKWLRKAVDKGDSNGMCNIGVMYYEGQGVTKDYSEAMKWLRKAAKLGNETAISNLNSLGESY